MRRHKKSLLVLVVLCLSICMLSSCGQSTASADEGGYTLDNIRDYVVGLDEKMELENGKKKAITNFDNAATTPALRPVMNEVNSKLEMYGSIGRGFSQKSNYSTDLYNSTRKKSWISLGRIRRNIPAFMSTIRQMA